MKFHKDGTLPTDDTVFVFGSNLRGVHGAGAARVAAEKFGATAGEGIGLSGNSYAIPTKDRHIETMPLAEIEKHIGNFISYTRAFRGKQFFVTRIGCGLAGYQDKDIAPMFCGAPDNCSFAEEWREFLEK